MGDEIPWHDELQREAAEVKRLADDFGTTRAQYSSLHSEKFLQKLASTQVDRKAEALKQFESKKKEINQRLEISIVQLSSKFKESLAASHKGVESILNNLKEEQLLDIPFSLFSSSQSEIEKLFVTSLSLIENFRSSLLETEKERKSLIEVELKVLFELLSKVRYPAQLDSVTPIKEHSELLNLSLAKNYNSIADLIASLLKQEHLFHFNSIKKFQEKLLKSKQLKHDHAIETFKNRLSSSEFVDPTQRRATLNSLWNDMHQWFASLLATFQTINKLVPPDVDQKMVDEFQTSINEVRAEQKTIQSKYIQMLKEQEQQLLSTATSSMKLLGEELGVLNVVSSEQIKQIMNECGQAVNHVKEAGIRIQEEVQQLLHVQESVTKIQCEYLFAVVSGAVEVFRTHLKKQEEITRDINEKRTSNWDQWTSLETSKVSAFQEILNTLHQSKDEASLKENTEKLNSVLNEMEQEFKAFFDKSVGVMNEYKSLSSEEFKTYQTKLCEYFGVMRESNLSDTVEPQEETFTTLSGVKYVFRRRQPTPNTPEQVILRRRKSPAKPLQFTRQPSKVGITRNNPPPAVTPPPVVEEPKPNSNKEKTVPEPDPSIRDLLSSVQPIVDTNGVPYVDQEMEFVTPELVAAQRKMIAWQFINHMDRMQGECEAQPVKHVEDWCVSEEERLEKEKSEKFPEFKSKYRDLVTSAFQGRIQQIAETGKLFDQHKKNLKLRLDKCSLQMIKFKKQIESMLKEFEEAQSNLWRELHPLLIKEKEAAAQLQKEKAERQKELEKAKDNKDKRTKRKQTDQVQDPPQTPPVTAPVEPKPFIPPSQNPILILKRDLKKTKIGFVSDVQNRVNSFKKGIVTAHEFLKSSDSQFKQNWASLNEEERKLYEEQLQQFEQEMDKTYTDMETELDKLLEHSLKVAEDSINPPQETQVRPSSERKRRGLKKAGNTSGGDVASKAAPIPTIEVTSASSVAVRKPV